ncbi:SDR family oxidoreductase [Alteromonadaceae bacterium M269]|nr:SDR family oxidoreductase [Alteromonadaceae bacterium M269]
MRDYVVVTGASRGLGLAVCRQLLLDGYSVVAVARALTDELKVLSEKYTDDLKFSALDLSQTDELPEFCQRLIKEFGRPYALINNAASGHDGVLATMPNEEIGNLLELNIQAPILLSKYLVRSMMLNRRGRIINISSIIAKTGFNGLSVYAATKAALEGFSRSLAREVGKAGITVNCVAPGYLKTDMTSELTGEKLKSIERRSPLGQLANVEDVAHMVSYLLSEKADRVTGTVMTVDAGSTA